MSLLELYCAVDDFCQAMEKERKGHLLSTGWSFGFKSHLVVNDAGELLAIYLTAANRHELKALPKLVKRLSFGGSCLSITHVI